MAETLLIPPNSSRSEVYTALLPQIEALISSETDSIANLSNVVAALREAFQFFWVGFYRVLEGELVLGPFQGPIACTRIAFHRGVCGHCYTVRETVVVPDVEAFPGHIACSSAAKSEIVIPVFGADGSVVAVLDVDSDRLNDFTAVDARGLEAVVRCVEKACYPK